MNSFVPSIYHDLLNRIRRIVQDLNEFTPHPGLPRAFLLATKEKFMKLEGEIAEVLREDFQIVATASLNLRKYNRFHHRYQILETCGYRVVLSYGDTEAYLRKKVGLILREIGFLQSEPTVTVTNSLTYYRMLKDLGLILIPGGEERSLLNFPDLYHEIGHLLMALYRREILGKFLEESGSYFSRLRIEVADGSRRELKSDQIDDAERAWAKYWAEEFSCDMIATFLCGVAYGWTNLKVSALGLRDEQWEGFYDSQLSHPSHESRTRAIFAMLEKLGLGPQTSELTDTYNEWEKESQFSDNELHQIKFPTELLQSLCGYVYEGCVSIGLHSYLVQVGDDREPLSKVLNEAWEYVRANPRNYHEWELATIARLQAIVAVG